MDYIKIKLDNSDKRKSMILVSGEAGTGKSHCLINTVKLCVEKELTVKVCSPTGLMANYYKELFQDIESQTVSYIYTDIDISYIYIK